MGKSEPDNVARKLPQLFTPARRYIGAELDKAKSCGDLSAIRELNEAQQLLDEAIGKVVALAHHHDDLNVSLKECSAELESLRLSDVDVDEDMLDRAAQAVRASEAFRGSLVAGGAPATPEYVDFDAASWGLYDVSGADDVAVDLNRTINDAIASFYLCRALGVSKAKAEGAFLDKISNKRREHANFGADDVWVGECISRVIQSVVNSRFDTPQDVPPGREAQQFDM